MKLSRMKAIWSFLLVVWLSCRMFTSAQKDVGPPWFTVNHRKETRGIKCHSNSTLLKLATAWLITTQLDFVKLASVRTLLITLHMSHFIQLPDNVSKLNEFMCMATALHFIHTHWSAKSVGDMAMDGLCTTSSNISQLLHVLYFLVVIFHIYYLSSIADSVTVMNHSGSTFCPPACCRETSQHLVHSVMCKYQ